MFQLYINGIIFTCADSELVVEDFICLVLQGKDDTYTLEEKIGEVSKSFDWFFLMVSMI